MLIDYIMRLIKVAKKSVGENLTWYQAMAQLKTMLTEYELQDHVDYQCHYMSGAHEFHILLNDGKESVASILALRFVQ